MATHHADWLYWFPGFWFSGFYEHLRPATHNMPLRELGVFATRALGCAASVFLLTFLPGYRGHARRVLETTPPAATGPGRMRAAFDRLLRRTLLRHPVEYAVFHFISQTITRSLKHRLFLATYGGFGAAFAVMTFGDGRSGLLTLPLTLSFILVSGLRAAFNFPAELGANWAFQLSEITGAEPYLAATRKWTLVCAILPLFVLHGADGVRLLPSGRRPVSPGVRHHDLRAADRGHVLRLPQGAVHLRAFSGQGQPDFPGRDLHLRIQRL